MVRIRGIFVLFLAFMILCNSSCLAYSYKTAPTSVGETIMTKKGSYVDLRGQIRSPYDPPNADKIPSQPRLQQTITNTEMYYKINKEGYRGKRYKLSPVPAEYTQHYSERTPHPYSKGQFVEVWEQGEKKGKVYLTDEYAMSYFFLDNWATGVVMAKIRARKFHKKPAVFLFIEDFVSDDGDMYKAKKFAELLGVAIFYGTIDKQIPAEWVR